MISALMAAIVDDDRATVRKALRADAGLASRLIDEPRLYKSGIFHWIYVGDTALHLAAAGYRTEIVELLLAVGANPNAAANHRRGRPLHYAADGYITGPVWDPKRQVKTIAVLLKAGADVQAQDKNEATPLHRAVRTRCTAAVKCLRAAGGDPAGRNTSASTTSHLAVQNTSRRGSGHAPAKAPKTKRNATVPAVRT